MGRHLLKIVAKPLNGAAGWDVALYLEGNRLGGKITLSDPFNGQDEADLRWYLEEYLTKSPFEKGRAEVAVESLHAYSTSLFDQLHLDRVRKRLSCPSHPTNGVLEIDIIEDVEYVLDSNTVSINTVHRLHWELLELPTLWNNLNLRTTVRRIIPRGTESDLSVKRVQSWSQGVPTVNILLVVARETHENPKTYDDVDPNQVFQSLQALKQSLQAKGAAFRLNIEIVRPGSFAALKKHLADRSSRRRNDDFHIVHFDLHGVAGLHRNKATDELATAVSLYFASSSGGGRLTPKRARAVADVLQQHNIRIAVLNSCESASAHKGNEANLARIFAQEGVQNVLAMSYRILSGACAEFMRCFYNSLIADGKPFSLAVADARESLRSSPSRAARFGLKKSLEDWIVPVVYASGEDVELCISGLPALASQIDNPESECPREVETKAPLHLIGRGFDVLRFETLFLRSEIIGLSGPPGVGKTAFLHYLLSCWKDTGLFEQTTYVDCPSLKITEDTAPATLLRCFSDDIQGVQPHATVSSAENAKSYDPNYQLTMAQLRSSSRVLVLDNLEATHSNQPEMSELGRWSENARLMLIQAIKDLSDKRQEGYPQHIVLVGRQNDDRWWEKHFSHLPAFPIYRLGGLSLPNAIEFAHHILENSDIDMADWGRQDEEVLSQVVNLTNRNPLAIETILRTAALQKCPWKSLFEKVLFHKLGDIRTIMSTTRDNPFFHRDLLLAGFAGSFVPEFANIFAVLALYWGQGCSKIDLKEMTGDEHVDEIEYALQLGVDRGYFSVDDEGYVDHIHPLFTIFTRILFIERSHQEQDLLSDVLIPRSLTWVLDRDPDSLPPEPSVSRLVKTFFKGISSRPLVQKMRSIGQSKKFGNFERVLRPSFYNILTTLRICSLKEPPVRIQDWPEALELYGLSAKWFLSVDETTFMVQHYENILQGYVNSGKNQLDLAYIYLMFEIGAFLVMAHLTVASLPTKRAKEFSAFLDKMVTKLTVIDAFAGENIFSRQRVQALHLRELVGLIDGSAKLQDSVILRAMAKQWPDIGDYLRSQEAVGSPYSWDQDSIPGLPRLGALTERLSEEGSTAAFRPSTRELQNSGLSPAEILEKGFAAFLGQAAPKPNPPDLGSLAATLETTVHGNNDTRRADLEVSLDVRDRAVAIKNLKGLLIQAYNAHNLEEALELVKRLKDLYGTDEAYAADLDQLLAQERHIEMKYQTLIRCSPLGIDINTSEGVRSFSEALASATMGDPFEYFKENPERLYNIVAEHLKDGSPLKTGRPKKIFSNLVEEYRQATMVPGGKDRLNELSRQIFDISRQLLQALDADDYEKALQWVEKLAEADDPAVLPSMPLHNTLAQVRQGIASTREFLQALKPASKAFDEGRYAEAIPALRSLLQRQAEGAFPGLEEHYIENLRDGLNMALWQESSQSWTTAFYEDNFSQALLEIKEMWRLEASSNFTEPLQTKLGPVPRQEYSQFSHLQTLHRYFASTGRPRLALKTLNHLLKVYDHPAGLASHPWISPDHIDAERTHKLFYEAELEKAGFIQCIAQGDFQSAVQQLSMCQQKVQALPKDVERHISVKARERFAYSGDENIKKTVEAIAQMMSGLQVNGS